MSVTITIPADLEPRLRRAADAQQRPAEEVALDILRDGLPDEPAGIDHHLDDEIDPDLGVVVAAIRALPRNPQSIRPGRGSLADFLADKITDEPFNLAAWEADWAKVEAELATLSRDDDRAAGRA